MPRDTKAISDAAFEHHMNQVRPLEMSRALSLVVDHLICSGNEAALEALFEEAALNADGQFPEVETCRKRAALQVALAERRLAEVRDVLGVAVLESQPRVHALCLAAQIAQLAVESCGAEQSDATRERTTAALQLAQSELAPLASAMPSLLPLLEESVASCLLPEQLAQELLDRVCSELATEADAALQSLAGIRQFSSLETLLHSGMRVHEQLAERWLCSTPSLEAAVLARLQGVERAGADVSDTEMA